MIEHLTRIGVGLAVIGAVVAAWVILAALMGLTGAVAANTLMNTILILLGAWVIGVTIRECE